MAADDSPANEGLEARQAGPGMLPEKTTDIPSVWNNRRGSAPSASVKRQSARFVSLLQSLKTFDNFLVFR